MKIGFIGTGAIAAAMVRALIGQGHEIWVSERNEALSQRLAAEFDEVERKSNQDIAQGCEVVILCLMAAVARQVLAPLSFAPGSRLISVMVDVDLDSLKQIAPAARSIDITIPLPQIASGGCPLPCYPSKTTIEAIFGAKNPTFEVQDAVGLNAHFAASALMSSTLDQIDAAGTWLGQFTGETQGAQFYIAHMLASALSTITDQVTVAQMLGELSTEGGLNATLKAHMRAKGVPEALTQGLDNLRDRLGLPT